MGKACAIALLVALLPLGMSAQRMSSGGRFGGHGFGHSFHGNSGDFAGRRSLGYPGLFYDSLYYDDLLASGYPVASQPPVVVMQYPERPASPPQTASAPVEPLVIELQGGHYVRVSGDDDSQSQMVDHGPVASVSDDSVVTARNEPPPALLVFRDGHQEIVNEYTIADGTLYARGDFYTDGTWTRRIDLSALNVPETVKANQSRGTRFILPTASNEVIVGP